MNEEKLRAFKKDLDELYKKHGLFLFTDPSAMDIYVCGKNEITNGQTGIIEITFDEEESEEYTIWRRKSDPYKGRTYEYLTDEGFQPLKPASEPNKEE